MKQTHSVPVAYILWILGFTGAHRFYVGKPVTGTVWFFTGGLLGIGWLVDFFFVPRMVENADLKFSPGKKSYSTSWILLLFLGLFGIHRFYLGKVWTGVAYLFTGALFGIGFLYDLWTLNKQVEDVNLDF
jgi:TM2 domain-containing membrane protein YozV